MPRALPGMPLSADDVFVCTGIGEEQKHAPAPVRRPPLLPDVWLVLLLCPDCRYPTRRLPAYYCPQHADGNWWLATMATRHRTRVPAGSPGRR